MEIDPFEEARDPATTAGRTVATTIGGPASILLET
jgi:hypothetical protein